MDYLKIYKNLIRKARKRQEHFTYMEKHHIIPKCIMKIRNKHNLQNKKWNIVKLTAKEHFIAHLLLLRISKRYYGIEHIYTNKLAYAVSRFINNDISSRKYSSIKAIISKNLSDRMRNRIITSETRLKMSLSKLNKPSLNKGKKGLFKHSEEAKIKMSKSRSGDKNWAFGKKRSEEHQRKINETKARNFKIKNSKE